MKIVRCLSGVLFLILAGCSSGGDPVAEMCTNATLCHQKFHKRAYNKPYEINGITYHPQKHYEYSEIGLASFYGGGDVFHNRKTSNGEIFDMNRLSAAHKTVPIPCVVLVTNLENGRALKLKINDRGPFIDGRIIDVSRKAARLLGFEQKGVVKVKVETLVGESISLAENMARGVHVPSPHDAPVMLAGNHNQLRPNHSRENKGIKAKRTPASHGPVVLASAAYNGGMDTDVPSSTNGHTYKGPSYRALGHIPTKPRSVTRDSGAGFSPVLQASVEGKPSKYTPMDHESKQPAVAYPVSNRNVRVEGSAPRSESVGNKLPARHARGPASSRLVPAGDSSGFFIQAGTFSRFTNAQNLASLLKGDNPAIPVKLHPVQIGRQQMFRVLIGPFRSQGEAHILAARLTGFDPRTARIVYE